MNKVEELLRLAVLVIFDQSEWTQCAAARDKNGKVVPSWSNEATSWDAIGILMAADSDSLTKVKAINALSEAAQQLFGTHSVFEVNDLHGHEAVMKMYHKAIENQKSPQVTMQQVLA